MTEEAGATYLRIRDQCLKDGKLFEDKDFPATYRSLLQRGINPNITWKRPHEIVDKPVFIREATYFDLNQGELGNCWFIAGINCLMVNSQLKFERVVPKKQSFDKKDGYAGIFRFNFWRFGKWVEVLVDDRLPVLRSSRKLIYCRNTNEPDEFWSPLVEKAYAKLYGCYENLSGGVVHNALVDMTGGVSEKIYLQKEKRDPSELYHLIGKMWKMDTMIGLLIFNKEGSPPEKETDEGLLEGHAYAVTNLAMVTYRGHTEHLIKMRNPWGRKEWKGRWSDSSKEWSSLKPDERKKIGLVVENEGEFWMTIEDIVKYFDLLDLCHQDTKAMSDILIKNKKGDKKEWSTVTYTDNWIPGLSAGGSLRNLNNYWKNPQFILDLEERTENTTVIISLMEIMEKNRKRLDIFIGFDIHQVKSGAPHPLEDENYNRNSLRFEGEAEITEWRENTQCVFLEPGKYVIIPYTQLMNKESRFLLRVFSEVDVKTRSDDHSPNFSNDELMPDNTFTNILDDPEWFDSFGLYNSMSQIWAEDKGFPVLTLETARCILCLLDEDRIGVIGIDGVEKVKRFLMLWHKTFRGYADDKQEVIDIEKLQSLYNKLGFHVGRKVSVTIRMRYANKDGNIGFDDFVQSTVKLLSSYSTYKEHVNKNRKNLNIMKWMELTMYI